jgi:hypothetical protein
MQFPEAFDRGRQRQLLGCSFCISKIRYYYKTKYFSPCPCWGFHYFDIVFFFTVSFQFTPRTLQRVTVKYREMAWQVSLIIQRIVRFYIYMEQRDHLSRRVLLCLIVWLRNLKRGGQGPTWAVEPYEGRKEGRCLLKSKIHCLPWVTKNFNVICRV